MSETLESMGAAKAIAGVTIKPQGNLTSLPLLYMHCYHTVFYRGKRKLYKDGLWAEYLQRNCFDSVISRFYYQDLYNIKNNILLSVKNADAYEFRKPAAGAYKMEGVTLTYTVSDIPVPASSIIRNLLCQMDEKGYFKKYATMITSISSTSFTVFVGERDKERLSTVINTTLLFYLRNQELHGVRYTVEEVE